MTVLTVQQLGVTPRKLVLIGFLGIVFLVVLIVQFGGFGDEPNVPSVTVAPARAGRRGPAQAQETTAAPVAAKKRPWPKITLEEVQQHDPFAALSTRISDTPEFPNAPQNTSPKDDVQERRGRAMAALGDEPPTIVLTGSGGKIVAFGERTFRVGDRLDDFRISEITPEGVVLEDLRN
jgi:hypothetical protein